MTSIIVVGAGLGGLALSLGLAQNGYTVELVEQRVKLERRGSAFGMAPNGIRALDELCPAVMTNLRQQGIYLPQTGGYLFGWWMVRDALLEQVRQRKSIQLSLGWTLASFDDKSDPSLVKVYFSKEGKNKSNNDTLVLEGSLLVGADGLYSTVRKLLDLPPAISAGKTHWRGSLIIPIDSLLDPYLDKGIMPFGITGHGPSILSLFNLHPKVPRQMTYAMSINATNIAPGTHPRQLYDKYFQENPGDFEILQEVFRLADETELTWPLAMSVVKMPDTVDKGWGGRGRVTLLGDAAHALRPAAGLGGAMAFEDAVVLSRCAKKLTPEDWNATREATQDFVRTFENERVSRVKIIWDDQWEKSEGSYKKENSVDGKVMQNKIAPWTPEFREWVYNGV
jgi:salicylate hydroxylase